jgi:hypothetical protein
LVGLEGLYYGSGPRTGGAGILRRVFGKTVDGVL